jgi:enoyl-[acyl-carrier protein] reductase/trans-2-enoyl-CoA reductase (NAD+)
MTMLVEPKVRGFICTTAHPAGCKSEVQRQIAYVKKHTYNSSKAPKNVLVIGASTGYGLASRVCAAFGFRANTLGVFFERPAAANRTASAGWYNSVAFEEAAAKEGLFAKSINGDAFSCEVKREAIEIIKNEMGGKIDLVIYSLASPKRNAHGVTWQSVLKPIGSTYSSKTINIMSGEISNVSIEPATDDEVAHTEQVMGGEDWQFWIEDLLKAGVMAEQAMTVAYSYIGPEMTYPIYRNGTIGKAKEHLEKTARVLDKIMQEQCNGKAIISVNKGLVTQASSAIPVVPLYMSIMYKIMKANDLHEGCIEQMNRLFTTRLYGQDLMVDEHCRIRLDDWELREDVQEQIKEIFDQINSDNVEQLSDIAGYRDEFYKLFGFNCAGVDYSLDVEVDLNVPSIPLELVNS